MARPRLPDRLKRNPNLCAQKTQEDAYILIGYSGLDPFEVSKRVYDVLDFFDGKRSNREARQLIREHMKAEPDDDLLISLYQLRILVKDERAGAIGS